MIWLKKFDRLICNSISAGEIKTMPKQPTTDDEAFVETPESEGPQAPPSVLRRQKLLIENGSIQWEQVPEANKDAVLDLLANDPVLLEKIANMAVEEGEGDEQPQGLLKLEHASMFLDLLSWIERSIGPAIVARASKGHIKVNPQVAKEAFSFKQEHKEELCPGLRNLGEEYIPEKIKLWIATTSEKWMVLGKLGDIMRIQLQNAAKLQLAYDATHPKDSSSKTAEQDKPTEKVN